MVDLTKILIDASNHLDCIERIPTKSLTVSSEGIIVTLTHYFKEDHVRVVRVVPYIVMDIDVVNPLITVIDNCVTELASLVEKKIIKLEKA